jgi:hypothetical protein
MVTRKELMTEWAEAITRLNAAEIRYDELPWWRFCARQRVRDHIACLRAECQHVGGQYHALEREERARLAE